jgi:hypothetical protein
MSGYFHLRGLIVVQVDADVFAHLLVEVVDALK